MAGLVISEIQYAPHAPNAGLGEGEYRANDFEFIELLNASHAPIQLSPFRLAQTTISGTLEGVSITFPQSTLPTGHRVVVARNAEAFRVRYGDVPNLIGEWTGGNLFQVRGTTGQVAAPELALFSPTQNLLAQSPAGGTDSVKELTVELTKGNWYIPTVSGAGSIGPAFDPFTGIGVSPGARGTYEIVVTPVVHHEPPQHNATLPADVNGDTMVSPFDALLVINYLNGVAANPGTSPSTSPLETRYLDVNNDQAITPIDALMVINQLNSLHTTTSQPAAATAAPNWTSANSAIAASTQLAAIAAAVDSFFADDTTER